MLALVLIFENIGVDRIIMQNILVNGVSFSNIRFLLRGLQSMFDYSDAFFAN